MKILKKTQELLTKAMNKIADFAGEPHVFATVILITIGWFIAGLFLEYDTWFDIMDVVIFTTTFFMLFVVQSSQNADTRAIQDKLDELLEAIPGTDTSKEKEEEAFKRGKDKGES